MVIYNNILSIFGKLLMIALNLFQKVDNSSQFNFITYQL
jgi:hypothetical protein